MVPEHPTPPRPQPDDVGRAVAAAIGSSGSSAELRRIVVSYVRALKGAGLPPEAALRRVKEVVGVTATVTPIPAPGPLPSDQLSREVVRWFLAEYYPAD